MRSVRLFRNDNVIRALRSFWDSSRAQIFGDTSRVSKTADEPAPDPYEGNFSFTECDQHTKVTVIGAAGRVGRTLSLLLKTCPLVDHLCLFDTDKAVKGIGVDISHVDTKCCVSHVCGMRNIQQALDGPDVVIIAAGCPTSPQLKGKKLFDKNAPIIAGLSEACARFCPKACVVLVTSPINSLLPVMGEVYQIITNRIPKRKLFGLTTLDVVRANTFVAEVIRKDPNGIIVPVVGGTSQDTIVPVFSQMKPCYKIKKGEIIALIECLKRAEGNLADCQNCGTRGASSLSTAYAAFRFTSSLVMALKGAENIVECAYVKSDIIPELEYLASPLKLGIRGVEYNFGYPQLSGEKEREGGQTPTNPRNKPKNSVPESPAPSNKASKVNAPNKPTTKDYEQVGLERAAAILTRDIKTGKEFVGSIAETVEQGLIWKRLVEDTEKEKKECRGVERPSKPAKENEKAVPRQRILKKETQEVQLQLLPDTRTPAVIEEVTPYPIYTQGVRFWTGNVQTSLKRWFFGSNGYQLSIDEGMSSSGVISAAATADLDCRNDSSLRKGYILKREVNKINQQQVWENKSNTDEEEEEGAATTNHLCGDWICGNSSHLFHAKQFNHQPRRYYHTIKQDDRSFDDFSVRATRSEKFKTYITDDRKKTFAPRDKFVVPKLDNDTFVKSMADRPSPWDLKFERTHYKLLNATAKQKFRNFNVQKRLPPSATVLFHLDMKRRERAGKNSALIVRQEQNKDSKETKGKEEESKSRREVEEEEEEGDEDYGECKMSSAENIEPTETEKRKQCEGKLKTPRKKRQKNTTKKIQHLDQREEILQQLQALQKENEELKRKLRETTKDRSMETALQVQTDNLELERTKLKACWLIMSSTMEAFSNFCRKFTSKEEPTIPLKTTEEREEETDEESADSDDNGRSSEAKTTRGSDKYYQFLESLMQDQLEGDKTKPKTR